MSITCPACGYENLTAVEFCEACGNELVASEAEAAPTTQIQVTEPVAEPIELDFSSQNNSFPDPFIPNATPAPVATSTAKLIAKRANSPVSEFVVERSAIAGRFDPDTGPVDIDLEGFPGDDTISRNHAEIYFEGEQWKIKDLGSTNGVFIRRAGQNRFGARIAAPEVLNPGDEVAIAKICFLFQT